jgi:hypothetical protein
VMDTVDHLLFKEGVDGMAGAGNSENCWKSRRLVARAGAVRKLGTGFGANHGRSEPNGSYARAMGV